MKIVISANCQTYGLAAALSAMCDIAAPVCIQNVGVDPASLHEQLARAISDADILILAHNNATALGLLTTLDRKITKLTIPIISFHAFHPDICYAMHSETRAFTRDNYNSAIALWAFKHGLSPRQAARLYSKQVFEALGYLDAWSSAYKHLEQCFADSDLANHFRRFYLAAKRDGCFMHSINHPSIATVVLLAEIIAVHLDISIRRQVSTGQLNDNLNAQIWPVYPDIADHLGLANGTFVWKYVKEGRIVDGLFNYLEAKFDDYCHQGLSPSSLQFVPANVQFLRSMDQVDNILKHFL